MGLMGILRIIFGSIIFLFIPGYAMTLVLFRARELDSIERITLSLVLSILVMPLIMLVLNQTIRISIKAFNTSVIILLIIAYSYVYMQHRRGTG